MVSLIGYSVGEFIMFAVATYVLLFVAGVVWFMVVVLKDNKPLRTAGVFLLLFIGNIIVYLANVRLGTVMFFNGVLVAVIVWKVIELGRLWKALMYG